MLFYFIIKHKQDIARNYKGMIEKAIKFDIIRTIERRNM